MSGSTSDAGEQAAAAGGGLGEPLPATLEQLFVERYAAMVRLAHLLTGSNAVAEDLVQDAFARMQRAWTRVDDPVAYLRTSVVNACRSWHRSHRREQRRLRVVAPVVEDADLGARELLDVLDGLPAGQRTAVVLRYYEGYSEAQIAEAMGCRPGTVKSHLHRALAALREVIER
jgi:RNA polymerase sigma-70 factor (sigma-E family)